MQRNVCNRGSDLFVACFPVQRHEAAIQEGVMKFHLCSVSSSNTHVPLFSCRHFVFLERRFSLVRFPLRKHCRVGTFSRIGFLFPCCGAAHSLCPHPDSPSVEDTMHFCCMAQGRCIQVIWKCGSFSLAITSHVSSLPGHRDTRALDHAVAR